MQAGARYGHRPAARKTSDLRVRVGRPNPATHRSARRETRATAEGEIERGDTRRALNHCLHKERHGTRRVTSRAVVRRKYRKTLMFRRAVYAYLRWACIGFS
jgi:hypothetical protein